MLSRYCAYPDFPSLRHNKYFRSCWEKQVAGVILEDRLDTPRRYWREASLKRAAIEDLHAEEAAASFITAWKDVWHPLSAKTMQKLSAAQVMIGAAVVLKKRYGQTWPAHCCLELFGAPGMLVKAPLPKTALGFLLMHTSSHWFLLCAKSGRTVVYDGYKQTDETLMQSLVHEGQQRLEQLGFPMVRPKILPGRWQHDSWSCGWHLLQTIRLICEGVISVDVQSSLPPLEHGALAKDINALALTMGLEGCIDVEAGGEAGVEPTIEGESATPRRQTTKATSNDSKDADYEKWTVKQLRAALERHGQPKTGRKAELLSRWKEFKEGGQEQQGLLQQCEQLLPDILAKVDVDRFTYRQLTEHMERTLDLEPHSLESIRPQLKAAVTSYLSREQGGPQSIRVSGRRKADGILREFTWANPEKAKAEGADERASLSAEIKRLTF